MRERCQCLVYDFPIVHLIVLSEDLDYDLHLIVFVGVELVGIWVHHLKPVGVAVPCFSPFTKIEFRLSLMFFHSMPESIKARLSLRSMDSLALLPSLVA